MCVCTKYCIRAYSAYSAYFANNFSEILKAYSWPFTLLTDN